MPIKFTVDGRNTAFNLDTLKLQSNVQYNVVVNAFCITEGLHSKVIQFRRSGEHHKLSYRRMHVYMYYVVSIFRTHNNKL